MNPPFSVYRHFDKEDKLLYVGYTGILSLRINTHIKYSAWGLDIAKITIENFPSKYEAMKHEKHLIETLKPKYNLDFNARRFIFEKNKEEGKKKREKEYEEISSMKDFIIPKLLCEPDLKKVARKSKVKISDVRDAIIGDTFDIVYKKLNQYYLESENKNGK